MATVEEAFAQALQQLQAGNYQQAEYIYRQLLQAVPNYAEAYGNLGVLCVRQGRLDEAITHYITAIRLKPEYAAAHFNLGNAYTKRGMLAEAVGAFQAAVQREPANGGMHYNLGLSLARVGRLEEALASFRQTVRVDPTAADAYNHLGDTYRKLGRLDDAAAAFHQALRADPAHVKAYNNLALVLMAQNKPDEAVALLRQAVRLRPDYAIGYNSLGYVLSSQNKADEAWDAYQQALRLSPDSPEILNNLGNSYREQGYLKEAIDCFRKAVAAQPHVAPVHSNLLLTLNYDPDYTPAEIFEEHRRWAEQHAGPLVRAVGPHNNDPDPDRRLRIGYLSPDFRAHTVAFFIEPLLAHHHHDQFHIACFANIHQPDETTKRMQAHADEWHSVAHLSDEAAARLIRERHIDILVDLAGHTAGNRLLVLAHKPAPVQATCFGYPNTTGLSTVDYRITDSYADPPGMTEQYSVEKLLRLPEIAWCYQPSASPDVGPPPAAKAGHVTFGSFNNLAKTPPAVIALWARILNAVPRSRLLLLNSPDRRGTQRVQEEFQKHGIGPDRVELVKRRPREEYLAVYNQVDIGLDPFPYNGGVTTCDALWMGTPVISLAGPTYVARQGVVLLANLGLRELIADTPDAYVTIATRLAGDLNQLRSLGKGLRERMRKSPVVDAARYLRNLEAAYRTIWKDWCADRRS